MIPAAEEEGPFVYAGPVRRQTHCPACAQRSAVFVCRHSSGDGLYSCSTRRCGILFRGPHPQPLEGA